jgi:hypothetical protein
VACDVAFPLAVIPTGQTGMSKSLVASRVDAISATVRSQLASHIGFGVNAAVLWAVADLLAQPAVTFTPFARTGPFAMAYAR